MRVLYIVGLVLLADAIEFPWRLPGSPYPACSAGSNTTRTLITYGPGLSKTQLLTLETLQGILARTTPRLFWVGGQGDMSLTWLDDLQSKFGVVVDRSMEHNYTKLLSTFRSEISGFVLCNASTSSVNVAISLCAALDRTVAVSVEDRHVMTSLQVPLVTDARVYTLEEVIAHYPIGKYLNNRVSNLQDPAKYDHLADWGVFARAVTFFDSDAHDGSELTREILAAMKAPGALLGWGVSEGGTTDALSARGLMIHAADWARNLATLQCFYVPTLHQVKAVDPPPPPPPLVRKHTVTFLMTDGDNIQWLVNDFASPSAPWFGSPDRGKVPLGWTISPALSELAPSVMERFYTTMSDMDEFVAGPSGVGYAIPDKFSSGSSLQLFGNTTSAYMAKADLRVVNAIQDNACGDKCARPFLDHDNIDAYFEYFGANYVGGNGAVAWSANGKPIIGGRYALWGSPSESSGFTGDNNDETSLSRRLRALSKDQRSSAAYSLIPVHVWTHNVSGVVDVQKRLGSEAFDFVTPSEFVRRLTANVFHECSSASKATGGFSASCDKCEDSCGALRNCACADGHGHSVEHAFFDHHHCPSTDVENCHGELVCGGSACTCAGPAQGSYTRSCHSCEDTGCGVLHGCVCSGAPGGDLRNNPFNYRSCPGHSVTNCFGALVCTREPCS